MRPRVHFRQRQVRRHPADHLQAKRAAHQAALSMGQEEAGGRYVSASSGMEAMRQAEPDSRIEGLPTIESEALSDWPPGRSTRLAFSSPFASRAPWGRERRREGLNLYTEVKSVVMAEA